MKKVMFCASEAAGSWEGGCQVIVMDIKVHVLKLHVSIDKNRKYSMLIDLNWGRLV